MKPPLNIKNILLLLLSIYGNVLLAQDTIVIDTILVTAQRITTREQRIAKIISERDKFVSNYIHFLNTYEVNENCELPDFFTNPHFDKEYGGQFMIGMHGRISLRKLIIDQLDNYALMWCVVKSNDQRLKEKYTGRSKRFYLDYSKIPLEQFSTFELVDMRLDELENEKNLGLKINFKRN